MRQKIARLIHDVNGGFAIGNADVDVQSENEIRARQQLHVFHDLPVALAFGDELIVPMRKRMRAGRGDLQSAASGEVGQLAAQFDHVRARIRDRLANLRAEFDHRLMHLGFDLLFEHDFAAFENFLNMRAQLARLRIDNRELLLDAEGVSVVFVLMAGRKCPQKQCAVADPIRRCRKRPRHV